MIQVIALLQKVLLGIVSCGEFATCLLYPVHCIQVTCEIFRYDELHPSEQADRVVARQVTNAILRLSNQWTTWFS